MDDRTVSTNTVSDETALRGLYQQPMELAVLEQLDRSMPIAETSSPIRLLRSSARREPAAAPT